MRSAVVLPQPEGPSSTMNSPSAIGEVEVVDRDDVAVEPLGDVLERHAGHAGPPTPGPAPVDPTLGTANVVRLTPW